MCCALLLLSPQATSETLKGPSHNAHRDLVDAVNDGNEECVPPRAPRHAPALLPLQGLTLPTRSCRQGGPRRVSPPAHEAGPPVPARAAAGAPGPCVVGRRFSGSKGGHRLRRPCFLPAPGPGRLLQGLRARLSRHDGRQGRAGHGRAAGGVGNAGGAHRPWLPTSSVTAPASHALTHRWTTKCGTRRAACSRRGHTPRGWARSRRR